MRSLTTISIILASCEVDCTDQQNSTYEPPAIWEKLPEVGPVEHMEPKRPGMNRAAVPRGYFDKRTSEDCSFPLDVLILQDATDSFSDNIESMKNTQLSLLTQGILAEHPDSRFGVVSFKDKPVYPLGNRDDYCQRFDASLSTNVDDVIAAYGNIVSYGGADAPENQFGALFAALQSDTPGWSKDPVATKLVVISTDAGPHYAGDSHTEDMGMRPFGGVFQEGNAAEQCLQEYYPSPEQVKNLIASTGAYVASLVYDGDWNNGWPSKSWIKFNQYIDQKDAFVAPQAPDSSDFWSRLAAIIATIEDIECIHETTPAPTTTPATTTPPATLPPATTAGECACPCEDCTCCPEVIIELQHKPSKLHLDIENAPVA
ncbi:integrin beta [Gregarina niphandrodes]|uniref:Integrin beta n=1 Tax=Gregarina niphandrodes TaxID=110365 RepID=A0A023BAV5_GRENI|nr:integrin beta [Gregarina niphandrodes]EZG78458.1 integrin beta [Gregarina niphandrodes]|eukprot:XP_011129291.1 integrin beta [Gregarina niphandrodes]